MATMKDNGIHPGQPRKRLLGIGLVAIVLVSGLLLWAGASWFTPQSTPLAEVDDIVADLETAQNEALSDVEEYLAFLRERSLPGVFDLQSPSWTLAENFYRAHWDVNDLRSSSGWFTPDLETLTPAPDWILPDTECSTQMIPGEMRGVEVFSVRDRANPQILHYVALRGGQGYVFSPLCNFTPAKRIAEARAALEVHLREEAESKRKGPRPYFEFVKRTNYPDLYDTRSSQWRLGEAILEEVWDLNELYRSDLRDLESIGILDLTLSQGDDGCVPSRAAVPAALWVVTTPAKGGEPYAEYFHYHEGRLSGFVALCDIKVSVDERGDIVLSSSSALP